VIRSVIIDGDIVAYQAAAAAEVAIEWEHDLWSVYSDLAKAEDIATKEIEDIANATKATKLILAFTDTHNFRKDVMPEYKANRSKKPKPIGLKPLKDRLGQRFTTYTKPGLEGDDVMGILATHPTLLPGQRIVVSIDKDMKTIPGIHYNPRTEKTLVCEPQIADYWHLFQTLTGDTTDGYPGCKGIGPKKAEEMLAPFLTTEATEFDNAGAWAVILKAYAKAGLTEADALANARVARICRHTDYDFKKNQVKLWTP
jgi:DNA polymerase-1